MKLKNFLIVKAIMFLIVVFIAIPFLGKATTTNTTCSYVGNTLYCNNGLNSTSCYYIGDTLYCSNGSSSMSCYKLGEQLNCTTTTQDSLPGILAQDQLQMTQNSEKNQRLLSQYGNTAYYACYPCWNKDTSNPYTQTSCLIQAEYCLEKQAIQKETACSSGYVYFNGRCVTFDQGCKEKYGQGSYYVLVDANGKYSCDCSVGYKWNDAVSTSPFLACIEDKNTITCNGKAWNNCPSGQSFYCPPTGDAQCLLPTPVPTLISTPIPTTKATPTPQLNIKKVKSIPTNTLDIKEKTIKPDFTSQAEKEIISENATKEELKVDVKVEAPKIQEKIKQADEGILTKFSNFFRSIGLKIRGWFN